MLQITIKADYAIRVVLFLAQQEPGKRFSAVQIAKEQDIPKVLIPKILQSLSHKGIVATTAGRNGGAVLSKKPEDVTIHAIIEATDGPVSLNRCLTETNACSRTDFCPVHPFWEKTRNQFVTILKDATISGIIDSYYTTDNKE